MLEWFRVGGLLLIMANAIVNALLPSFFVVVVLSHGLFALSFLQDVSPRVVRPCLELVSYIPSSKYA